MTEKRRTYFKLAPDEPDTGAFLWEEWQDEILFKWKTDFIASNEMQERLKGWSLKKSIVKEWEVGAPKPDQPVVWEDLSCKEKRCVTRMFESMLTKNFSLESEDEREDGRPKILCDGTLMVRLLLFYGVSNVIDGQLLKSIVDAKAELDKKRKDEDIAMGRHASLPGEIAQKNRFTINHNIPERKQDNKEFKDVVKVAHTLRMGHLLAQELDAVWYDHEKNHKCIAGALVGGWDYEWGPVKDYDGKCWGHIYGPLYCGNNLGASGRQPRKNCFKCFQTYHRCRWLCDGCCKQREMSEKTYCLTEQCPAKKEEFAFGPGPTAH